MKKSTKIIATAVALALVVAAMVVGIYAATGAASTISAAVTWSATQGIEFRLAGSVAGGNSTPTMATQIVTASTSNTTAANLAGNLGTGFKDADKDTASDDGVNNPGAITYTYYICNTGSKTITVSLSKYPAQANESGTAGNADTHKPKVAWTIKNGCTFTISSDGASQTINETGATTVTYSAITLASGISLSANKALSIKIVLSMASGGTGTINADTSITSFDAGVTFALTDI